MRLRNTIGLLAVAAVALTVALACAYPDAAAAAPASATATLPPHVAAAADTDVCAMCHRTHSAPSRGTWTNSAGTTSSALLAVPGEADVELCYTCHGVDALGSGTDVQSSFEASSAHLLAPSPSAFGPASKQCGTCHDAHGSARVVTGTPYPDLLRSVTVTGSLVYQGDQFCTSCHWVRSASRFPGAAIWAKTPHAAIEAPTASKIVCSACHEPHGSPYEANIRSSLVTPSAPATAAVKGDDRTLCAGCHRVGLGVWPGSSAYASSAHASSASTVPVGGEWASVGATRTVGECQACHNAMGTSDGTGNPLPNLLDASGRALCDRCHQAAGPAKTDFASLKYSPTTPGLEVLASFEASVAAYGRVALYARESTAAAIPSGPRIPDMSGLGAIGPIAAGDVDGDSTGEALVASTSSAKLAMLQRDASRIVSETVFSLPGGERATALAVGDVYFDLMDAPETVYTTAAGKVITANVLGHTMLPKSSATVTGTPTAIALGDLTDGPGEEIVVTTTAPDRLYVLSDDGLGGLRIDVDVAALSQPVAAAVADIDDVASTKEIAVAYAGELTDVVALYRANGTEYLSGGGPLAAGAQASALAVGDIFPGATPAVGTAGREIAVTFTDEAGDGGVRIMPSADSPLVSMVDTATPAAARPSGLALGDANGDGRSDVTVALAGSFTHAADAVPPSLRVLQTDVDGQDVTGSFDLKVGGVEAAGRNAHVVAVDLGAIGPSRHTVGQAPGAHESTESAMDTRHVECSDCHNSHLAKSASADTSSMPGALIGAQGVIATNIDSRTVSLASKRETATAEYEVCFSCHSRWASADVRSIASEINTLGASFHPIEGEARADNSLGEVLVNGAQPGDTLTCSSCHGRSSASTPAGPHRSTNFPLLKKPQVAIAADSTSGLCVTCHEPAVYVSGLGEVHGVKQSGFYNTADTPSRLHSYHASLGMACGSCHESHGNPRQKHLLRDEVKWTETVGSGQPIGGSCVSGCHMSSADYPYVF